ncbi:MAG: 4Fe-4S binding protein [Deltaproteobacteria bacterium]|nr:4Fe-4S binding protein [Deltaproteobacteria bacterium]MBW2200643.1 4Fe-4S binding protein [Deltaproteobacteria bacterium]
MPQKMMLQCDRALCTECHLCEMVCSAVKAGVFDPRISRIQVVAAEEAMAKAFACVNCEGDPPCIKACPRHGLSRDPDTKVILIQEEECDRCGSCVEACPYGAIILISNEEPAVVCDLCRDRDEPACVTHCPTGALKYGNVLPIPRKIAKRQINISLSCNNCGDCVSTCSSLILKVIDGWLIPTEPVKCQVCEHCATNCPIGAIRINRRSKILF